MSKYYDECYAVLKDADVFPIEVDLTKTMLNYSPKELYTDAEEEEEEEKQSEENGEKLFDDE